MDNLAFLVPNNFKAIDIVQIVIIFFALYELVKSLKNTRAWLLVKGIIALVLFYLFCVFYDGRPYKRGTPRRLWWKLQKISYNVKG